MTAPSSPLTDTLDLELTRHARLLNVLRTRIAQTAPPGVDLAALGVLKALLSSGAGRQGELACTVGLDPSTTSRYVAQLTRAGLVERRPDPQDGRAVQLVATEAGQQLGARISAHRHEVIHTLLADWNEEDLQQLHRLMARLNDAIEQLRPSPAAPPLPEQES